MQLLLFNFLKMMYTITSSAREDTWVKIVLARIFPQISSLRERLLMSKNQLRSSGEPQRGGFANRRGLNVTRAVQPIGAT